LSNLIERGDRYDLIVSRAVLEHVHDLDGHLGALRALLAPNGVIAIGWGPLWHSPYGAHITYLTRFPWAHLLFPARIILRARARARPNGPVAQAYSDWVNCHPLAEYERAFRASGLEQIDWRENVSGRPAARAFRTLARVPGARRYATFNVYGAWRETAATGR
jgi:hypothetical protein